MALTVRTIATATGKPLLYPDGSIVADKPVTFTLVSAGGGMLCVVDSSGSEVVSKRTTVQTGVDGSLSISLWPTSLGDVACMYFVSVEGIAFKAPLPAGVGTLDWDVFVAGRDITDIVTYVPTPGAKGDPGSQIYSGAGVPSNSIGVTGDYYFNTTGKTLYGPKSGGEFPAGISIVGASGTNGVDGSQWYTGSGVPSGALGVDNDYYFATDTSVIYQKVSGTWESLGTFIGATGEGVPEGGTVGQHLYKVSSTDFDTAWGDAIVHRANVLLLAQSFGGL